MKLKSAAFTLVEVMITVTIIADLALIAIPNYQRARRTAQNARFTGDLRVASAAFELYAAENGKYPDESNAGVIPPRMDQYLRGVMWSGINSIGGLWDWDNDQGYAKAAVAVSFTNDADILQMEDIDKRIDNGILSTGSFRQQSSRKYAMIIEL